MITNLIFIIGSGILDMFSQIFSVFNFEVPIEIRESMTYILSAVNYVNNQFPLIDALLAGVFLLGIYWRLYIIKIFLWMWSLVPKFGSRSELPNMANNASEMGKSAVKSVPKIKNRLIRHFRI